MRRDAQRVARNQRWASKITKRARRETCGRCRRNFTASGVWISRVNGISRFFCCEGIAIVIFEKSNLGSGEPPFFDGRNSLHEINAPLHGVIYLIFEEQAMQEQECVNCRRKFFGHSCFVNHKSAGSYKKNNRKVCDIVRYVKIV